MALTEVESNLMGEHYETSRDKKFKKRNPEEDNNKSFFQLRSERKTLDYFFILSMPYDFVHPNC